MRQGCCLSLILFNIYIEDMLSKVLNREEGVSPGRKKIQCVSFTDDIVVLANETGTCKKLSQNKKIAW